MKKIFSPNGRLRRRNYLVFDLIFTILIFLIEMILEYLKTNFNLINLFLMIFIFIFLLILFTIMTIKRFHDIEYSGWSILLLLIPIINLGGSFLLLFKDGTVGPNKYGADPKKRIPKEVNIIDKYEEEKINIIKKEKICSNCGMTNKISFRYCAGCGYELPKN